MPLVLYDTLDATKREFTPPEDGPVRLYVCGVTPYDTTHAGHARTYLVFDVLVRHLTEHGVRVNYVQNITDVDESILERAGDVGEDYRTIGDHYTNIYFDDIAHLNMLPATLFPRATSAMEEMQEIVRRLLASDFAYRVSAGVFFRVGRVPYGKLSKLSRDDMLAVEREQDDSTVDDPSKEDPLDIPLWRVVHDQGPSWTAPWGNGRPGWHLECSTLALRHLGTTIDIHGGGEDLKFPHHEAEIAQTEAATGVDRFCRFWMHVGTVTLGGEKMAKSTGNSIFVRDLLKDHSPDALRLYLLSRPYRERLDFDLSALAKWEENARTIAEVAARTDVTPGGEDVLEPHRERFEAALDDDLDTATAIATLLDATEAVSSRTLSYAGRRSLRLMASRLGLLLHGRGD